MKTEMDVLKMDERQRLCWLLANRAVLMLVGVCWLAMIAWELGQGRSAYFLIIMIPAFALIRLALYKYYQRRALR